MNKHILIIRLSSFGDVAMTVPVIAVLRKTYPKAKITILTSEFFSSLYNQVPEINFIFFKQKHKSLTGLLSLSNEIYSLNPDYIIDLHNIIRTKFLRFFSRISPKRSPLSFKVDKGRKQKQQLLDGRIFKKLKSMHQRYADVFSALDITLDLKRFKFYNKIDITRKKYDFNSNKKLIGIAPFAGHTCKEYSVDNILEIIDSLNNSHEILIFGASGIEENKINDICLLKKNTYNISSSYSLEEQMAIISNLQLMISMDSANGHIASLFGINVVTIWGPTHPYTGYGPFMQPDNNSITPERKIYPKIPVSIYGSKCPQEYLNVINSIEIEKILKRVRQLI